MPVTTKTAPHVGALLRKYLDDKRLFQSAWARDQGVSELTVAKYFKKESMQISTLFTICQVLKYNFIQDIASQLPPDLPPHTPNPLQAENETLKTDIENLKQQIALLKEIAGVKNKS